MFTEIFLFELKLSFRKPATYIYFVIFFALSLFIGLAAAGVFDVAQQDSNVVANSAYAVTGLLVGLNDNILGLVNSIILVAVMATAIQKDYQYQTHPFFFTKPITKSGYFLGRFVAALCVALFVFSGQLLGYGIGCLFGAGTPFMGPFHAINFIQPFVLFTVQNVLLLGVIIFSITTYTRSTLSAYLFCIILLVIRIITDSVSSELDNTFLAAIVEPFGKNAFSEYTKYWTPEEQNARLIPLSGVLLYNRMLWLGIAVLLTWVSYYRFSFTQFLQPFTWWKRKPEPQETSLPESQQSLHQLPVVHQDFSKAATWRNLFYLSLFEYKKMTKSTFFIIICALGMVMMFVLAQYMDSMYETETYPVTYKILDNVAGIFQFFILILVVFFSGTIIWREREVKMDELVGASPVSNATLYFSKYLGLIGVVAVLQLVIMLTGILIQLSMSFTQLDLGHYLMAALRMTVDFSITIGLCLAVQVFTPNKYLGFFLSLVPLLFMNIVFSLLEWNNQLYMFGSGGPSMPYSDMNGYGHTVGTWLLYNSYWLSIVLLLGMGALLLLARGKEKGWKAKYLLSRTALKKGGRLAALLMAGYAFAAGGYIFYNTHVLNKDISPKEFEKKQAAYEKKYKRFERTPQPRIVASSIKIDFYTDTRGFDATGVYTLKNKHTFPIDTILIDYASDIDKKYRFEPFKWSKPHTLISDDKPFGTLMVKLSSPLQPGDSLDFTFRLHYAQHGFENSSTDMSVVHNGTFINNQMFPSIGYNADAELGQNIARKKYGLAPKPRMAAITDSVARRNTYISRDADWIRFKAEVSTSADQIAIAPGYLQKEWTENGRHHFIYTMDRPLLNFYAFLSARYQVKRDKWKDVNIEIYYHKGHEYNLDRMVKSIKQSLDYYTTHFSPYQHRQVRIIEFPRYANFAQSFPNTIPFSESIGFIAKVADDPNKIDVPFYVTAHEVAHQWWAHQVIGGNVQGSVLMSETMSQYSALMVMEKEYGKSAMKKFLKYEMDDYLKGRAMESKKEVPLMLCENQNYIHYNKGSVIMYSLRDYLGEDVLNAALRSYIHKVAFQEPPYTNAIEFVNELRAVTPDSLQYLIKDMFETITIYENYVKELSYQPTADGAFQVTMMVGSAKFRSDSVGKQTRVPVADYIDVGVFSEQQVQGKTKEKELVLQRIKMDQPEKTFRFIVKEKPVSAGIDPYHKLIDRTPDNNTWKFGSKPPKVNVDAKETKERVITIGDSGEE